MENNSWITDIRFPTKQKVGKVQGKQKIARMQYDQNVMKVGTEEGTPG